MTAVVRVRYFAAAREATGAGAEELAAASVAELLAAMRSRHGDRLDRVLAVSTLLVDGERLDPRSDRPLADRAAVDVLPPFAGG